VTSATPSSSPFAVKACPGHQRQGVTSRLVETSEHLPFAGAVVQVLPEENSLGLAKLVGKTLNTDLCASSLSIRTDARSPPGYCKRG